MPAPACAICGDPTDEVFRKLVLGRHDVGYRRCRGCGFLQTEPPWWLAEAYLDAISSMDTGLLARTLSLAPRVESVIRRACDPAGRFLDYGGGSGIFVRAMRDRGFRFHRHDPHAAPVFSPGLDLADLPTSERRFELVTAFEVLEHLPDPVAEVSAMLGLAPDLLCSTELVPTGDLGELSDWWYLGPEHGQHVSFYTGAALARLAARLGVVHVQLAPDLHLLSRDPKVAARLERTPDPRSLEPLTAADSRAAAARLAAGKAGRAATHDLPLAVSPIEPAVPASENTLPAPRCWCGNSDLDRYSPEYLRCRRCDTLVAAAPPRDPSRVVEEGSSLYGLNYFNDHARAMGHPTLEERARLDLAERCAFWLETLLRFRPPPARTLELGCANGAFVALLTEAGYDATGLDLSPGVTRFVQEAFQVPVLTGPLEAQQLAPGSFDVIAMMDVLEHLPDPAATLRAAAPVLAPGGILLVQTPRFEPSRSYEELRASGASFLAQLKPAEHLFLLSEGSARTLLAAAGFDHLTLVPAIFAEYDMSFVASRTPLAEVAEPRRREALRRTRTGRVVEAVVDAGHQVRDLSRRTARLEGELAGVRERLAQAERAHLAELDSLRGEIAGLTRELGRLREVEEERDAILRRLGMFAGLFQRRQARP